MENHAPQRLRGQFWTLDSVPEILLGDRESLGGRMAKGDRDDLDGRIWQVHGLARLVDGRIAVLSRGNHQLFIFEPSGKLSRTIGSEGEGPGEFASPERMQYLPPDTLAVWDHWMGPVTYFDTAGAVLHRRRIDLGKVLASVPGATVESATFALPHGSMVVEVDHRDSDFARPRDGTLVRYPPVEYVRVDLETYVSQSLGIWDGQEKWAVPNDVQASYPKLRGRQHDLVPLGGELTSQLTTGGVLRPST